MTRPHIAYDLEMTNISPIDLEFCKELAESKIESSSVTFDPEVVEIDSTTGSEVHVKLCKVSNGKHYFMEYPRVFVVDNENIPRFRFTIKWVSSLNNDDHIWEFVVLDNCGQNNLQVFMVHGCDWEDEVIPKRWNLQNIDINAELRTFAASFNAYLVLKIIF